MEKMIMKNCVKRSAPRISAAVVLLGAGTLALSPAVLQAQTWNGGVSTDWSNAANWVGGLAPPQNFGLDNIIINNNNPVVLLSNYDPGGAAFLNPALYLGNTATDARLTIGSGGLLRSGANVRIGGSELQGGTSDGRGSVLVTNGGQWFVGGGLTTRIGDQGVGALTVSNGGVVSAGGAAISLAHVAGSQGTISIGGAANESATVAGSLVAGSLRFGSGNGRVVFNHTNTDYTFGAAFFSSDAATPGAIDFLSGTTILTTHSNEFSGVATVGSSGRLVLNADGFGDLAGSNTVDGSSTVLQVNGGFATHTNMGARAAVTRTIYGDLLFGSTAVIDMGLGQPGPDLASTVDSVGDVIHVTGTLLLDGTLNIHDLGDGLGGQGFNFGRYELFTYGDLDAASNFDILGTLPSGIPGTLNNDSLNNRIILVVEQALGANAWWSGGDGTWSNTAESWSADASGDPPLFAWNEGTAIFNGAGATVSVTENVNFSEISFEANGYVIADGGGDVLGKPADDEQSIVNLGAMTGITGEIATGLKESRAGLQMRKYGAGTVVLSGNDNAWTGGTTIEQGTLQIGNGGATGVLPGNVVNGGTVAFNRNNAYTYGGVISGGGQLRQIGSGTTILSGNNTYGGLTTISSGTLQIGTGGSAGSIGNGGINVGASGTLALNRSGDLTFANTITGAGALAQRGGGLLSLTGNLSGFTGKLLAENGDIFVSGAFGGSADISKELTVNGSMAGLATVLNGGTLRGTGTVGGVTVQNGGTLAPGNSIGAMTVNGPLTFASGSIFEAEVASDGTRDRLTVNGNLTINGGTVQVLAQGAEQTSLWRPYNTYNLITYTGTRTGEFEDVTSNFAFLTPELDYSTNGVVTLYLDRNDIDFAAIGLTPNQIAVGAATEALDFDHVVADTALALVDAVLVLSPEDARAAFDSLSGEIHASTRSMLLDDSRLVRDAVLSQSYARAGTDSGTQFWMRALGHRGEAEGEGVSTFERDATGAVLGADFSVGQSPFSLGWAVGYHMNGTVESETLRSEGDVNNMHVALYGGMRQASGIGARLGLAQSWHEVDIQRTVAFPGYEESMSSSYNGTTLQAFGEVDYRIVMGNLQVAPFLGLAWARLETDGFEEADFRTPIGSTATLHAESQASSASFGTLGTRGALVFGASRVHGMLGYRRALSGDEPDMQFSFMDGNQTFDVAGTPIARDALVADLGFDIGLSDNLRLGAAYNGQVSRDTRDHAIEARLVLTLE